MGFNRFTRSHDNLHAVTYVAAGVTLGDLCAR
jgi:hypothetical protein